VAMEFVSRKKLLLFSGRGAEELSQEIAACLGVPLGDVRLSTFSSGELYARYGENVRGADAFIVQSHSDPINDRIMEQLIMIDAAKRASAKRITAVCPFFGYARQDHKAEGREPLSARLVADLFTVAGADRVVTVDLHAGQIQGFFNFPVDHLTALPVLGGYLAEQLEGDVVVVSPDPGRIKLAQRYANFLGEAGLKADLAFIHKRRPKGTHNVAEAHEVVGSVDGQACVLIDDIIDTAGTITAAADLLHARGAREISVVATHPVLSGPAIDRLKNAPLRRVAVTNTVPIPDDKRFDALEVLSIAPVIADVLGAVFEDRSVSEIFRGDNV
jgi:ribose-phosphate pyrophosphokinase